MNNPREDRWAYLPYLALCKIFQYLNYKELISVGKVCKLWYEASYNDLLWKNLFHKHFMIDRSIPVPAGRTWLEEFKRLSYNVPLVETESLMIHSDMVLHVSFSHNGKYFSTCSKDGYVIIWKSKYPAKKKFIRNMKHFQWEYTKYSQFNESDTLLLVSGVHFGLTYSTSGEIAVFDLKNFELQCRVINKPPYDIFGAWYSDQYFLSEDLHWLAHLVSTSHLWLNKASQEADSELVPITHCLFRFYNRNASSIRSIIVANCLPNSEHVDFDTEEEDVNVQPGASSQQGNSVSNNDFPWTHLDISRSSFYSIIDSMKMDFPHPIWYNEDYRQVELEHGTLFDSDDEVDAARSTEDSDDDSSESSFEIETDRCVLTDKYLIFTTGCKAYTPHQIGFKRIKPYKFPKRMELGPSLKERLMLLEQRKKSPPPDPDWLDFDKVADKFDKIDHVIDLHGHIVGMGLSPDQRYLYVNSRSWPENYTISNPLDPPPIAQEIDIHVIDLVTLKQVGKTLRAHKAFTPDSEYLNIFLDVSNEYVASGAEDKHAYLWDRHYGACLVKFPHNDVVNSVAFNPKDPEMLVTVSDDRLVKIWRSKAKIKSLNLNETVLEKGIELRKDNVSNNTRTMFNVCTDF